MPESCSRRGEPMAPQLMITSRSARKVSTPEPVATVTPTARPFSISIFSVCALRRTVRFVRVLNGLEERAGGRRALGVAGGELVVADAVLHGAVEIVVERNARLLRGAQEGDS